MAMFDENFTFEQSSRSPSLGSLSDTTTRDTSRSVSPCTSPLSAFPPPRLSVADLTLQFATHRIRRDAQIAYDSCAHYAASDDDAGWNINDSPVFPRPTPRPHSPTQRAQRQSNARLLCSSISHQREIADLVTRMVENGEQCCVSTASADGAITPDDEGYGSEDAPLERRETNTSTTSSRRTLDYRRASDLHSITGASVSKSTRFRKSSTRKKDDR